MKTNRKAAKRINVGDRFGHLVAVSDSGERKNGYVVWECRCDCGNTTKVDIRTLRRGTVTDCGCITKLAGKFKEITGERFGMLTAIRPTGKIRKGQGYIWHCVCDCGEEVDVPLLSLMSGHRKSCGCVSHPPVKDLVGQRFGKLTVTSYAGKWNKMHHWNCRCDCGNETTVLECHLIKGNIQSCGCKQTEARRKNMKLIYGTSIVALEYVRDHLSPRNTSGYTGVAFLPHIGKWRAMINFKGEAYYLGYFTNMEEAIKVRRVAENELHHRFLDWYYNEYLPHTNISVPKRRAVI